MPMDGFVWLSFSQHEDGLKWLVYDHHINIIILCLKKIDIMVKYNNCDGDIEGIIFLPKHYVKLRNVSALRYVRALFSL